MSFEAPGFEGLKEYVNNLLYKPEKDVSMTNTGQDLANHLNGYTIVMDGLLRTYIDSISNRDLVASIDHFPREEFIKLVKQTLAQAWMKENNMTPPSKATTEPKQTEQIQQPVVTFDYQLTAAQAYAGNVALHNRAFILEPSMIANDLQRCVLHIRRDKQGQVNVYSTMAPTSSDKDIKLAKQELKTMVEQKDEEYTGLVDICVDRVLRPTDITLTTSAFVGEYWIEFVKDDVKLAIDSVVLLDWGTHESVVTGLFVAVARHGTDRRRYRITPLTGQGLPHPDKPTICYLKNGPYLYANLVPTAEQPLLTKVVYQTPRITSHTVTKEQMQTTAQTPSIVNAPPQIRILGTQDVNRSGNYDEINDTAINKDVPLMKIEQLVDRDDYGQYTPLYWSPSDLVELVKSKLLTHHKASLQTLLDSAMSSYLKLFDNRKVGVLMRRYNLTQGLRLTFQNLQPRAMGEIIGLKATVEVIAFVPEFERSEDLQDGRGVALSVTQSVIL